MIADVSAGAVPDAFRSEVSDCLHMCTCVLSVYASQYQWEVGLPLRHGQPSLRTVSFEFFGLPFSPFSHLDDSLPGEQLGILSWCTSRRFSHVHDSDPQ